MSGVAPPGGGDGSSLGRFLSPDQHLSPLGQFIHTSRKKDLEDSVSLV